VIDTNNYRGRLDQQRWREGNRLRPSLKERFARRIAALIVNCQAHDVFVKNLLHQPCSRFSEHLGVRLSLMLPF
jgi:hypothetical protein